LADTDLIAAPTEVVIHRADMANPRFTPRELRLIRETLGRSFSSVLADEESDDKFVVLAWLKLRRDGHELAWEEMDDVVLTFVTAEPEAAPDPMNGQPPTISPRSAGSGE
jgi:hypothetical protein